MDQSLAATADATRDRAIALDAVASAIHDDRSKIRDIADRIKSIASIERIEPTDIDKAITELVEFRRKMWGTQ